MALQCPNCKHETAEREPGEPRAMERYICAACAHEFFVHCHYVSGFPKSAPELQYLCRYRPSSERADAKAYLQLKRLLAKYKPYRTRYLEEQYGGNASVWLLGTFRKSECEQLVHEAATLGLVIEATHESAT